jgi:hypothetical protein
MEFTWSLQGVHREYGTPGGLQVESTATRGRVSLTASRSSLLSSVDSIVFMLHQETLKSVVTSSVVLGVVVPVVIITCGGSAL